MTHESNQNKWRHQINKLFGRTLPRQSYLSPSSLEEKKRKVLFGSSFTSISFGVGVCGCALEWIVECLSFDHMLCRVSKVRARAFSSARAQMRSCPTLHRCPSLHWTGILRWGPSRSANRQLRCGQLIHSQSSSFQISGISFEGNCSRE